MSNLTKPPILDETGQDILTALGAIKQNLPQGGGSNGYAPTDATETTLADDDKVPFYDTSASGKRNSTWANIKAKLQSFFETIFVTIASLDGTVFVEKTYAEYEALSEAQKNDGKVEYFITDLDDIDYAVQDDPTATDLVNDEVPTGGTVKSWAKTQYVTAGQASGSTLGTKATAEGYNTTASGYYSHAEGSDTTAGGAESHAEGYYTTASHSCSHAEGFYTKTGSSYQHVQGKYNEGKSTTAFEIGWGTANNARKNIFEVDQSGNVILKGSLNIGSTITPTVYSSDTVTISSGHTATFKLWSNGMKSFHCEDANMPIAGVITDVVIPLNYVPASGYVRGFGWNNNYSAVSASTERGRAYTLGTDRKIYLYQGVALGFYTTIFYI